MSHTPGPWRWEQHANEYTIESSSPSLSATVATINSRPSETGTCDARLIAAAPDLYAALIRARNALKALEDLSGTWDLYQHSPEMKTINAAIAKAGGR